ncbi:MAG: preprotein translocase subunit SecY [Christensenellaceae bacterium]
MFQTIKQAFKIKEIRVKIFWTFLFILLYRFGCYIPVPGIGSGLISSEKLSSLSYLNIISMMTGGALQNGTWFAMGIGPYINASIIIQLLTVAIPALERMSRMGEEGQKKIAKLTRYGALIIAIIQSITILVAYGSNIDPKFITYFSFGGNETVGKVLAYITAVVIFASGTMATVWIGERITDYGVSNGISLLIFVGVLSTAGIYFISLINGVFANGGNLNNLWILIGYVVAIIIVFFCIVFVELAERKIPVQYAKRVQGRKMYGGTSTVIPIKVNASGVMPLIFAFSFISLPELVMNMIGLQPENKFFRFWMTYMGSNSVLYAIILCLLILGFSYFYASIQFRPDEISRSIQQNGGNIIGIRPGKPTTDYLKKIQHRITLFGAIFLAIVALVPTFIFGAIGGGIAQGIFSSTGMLICVSIALEFNNALESQIMMKQYKGFLK